MAERQNPREKDSLHANAIVFEGAGLLIRGAARAGKSALSFALMTLADEKGLRCRLVGDDRILVERQGDDLIARGHPAIQGMIEKRGEGIVRVPSEPEVVLRLIIDFVPPGGPTHDCGAQQAEICGVKLPRLALAAGRSSYECALAVHRCLHQTGTI